MRRSFPKHLVSKAWALSSESARRVHVSEEDGGDKRLFQLAKLIVLLRQILFNLATAATAEAILMRISAELVPSLYRFAPGYLKLVTSSNSSRSC